MKGEAPSMTQKEMAQIRQNLEGTPDIEEAAELMNLAGNSTRLKLLYLLENMNATVVIHESTPLFVELPAAVELTITETEPGVQGDRSTGGTKPATLETGANVAVPLFITTGERIRVDTRTGEYLGRVTG